jgi:hypothetical protein
VPVAARHACLCCRQPTLAAAPPGTWLACPVCGWTDIALDTRYAENQLDDARRAHAGASASAWPPRRQQEAATLVREIETAFAHVSPAGRVSLREAYRADYFADPPAGELGAEWTDADHRWSEIPDEVIEYFAGRTSVFIFGNARSFHYYLPAHLAHDLRTHQRSALEALLRADDARRALLDPSQREVVRRYLQHLLDFTGPDERVAEALARLG